MQHDTTVICQFLGNGYLPRGRCRAVHYIMARNKNTQYLDCIRTRKVPSKVQKPCRHECALFFWTRVDWWHLPALQYLAILWSGSNTRDTTCLSVKMNEPRPVWVLTSEGSSNNDFIKSIFLPCDIDIRFMWRLEIYCYPWQLSRIYICWYQSEVWWCIAKNVKSSWLFSPMLHMFHHMHLILRLTSLVNSSCGSGIS